jgi:hypothetical protein
MVQKHPICPERIRKVPKQFSWLDQRLVRAHHIDRLSHPAAALYLFLVIVADAKGLSYYGDHTLSKRLAMDENTFFSTRRQLIQTGLIAYKDPLYQVLALGDNCQESVRRLSRRSSDLKSLGQIFKQIGEDAHD